MTLKHPVDIIFPTTITDRKKYQVQGTGLFLIIIIYFTNIFIFHSKFLLYKIYRILKK